MQRPHVLAGLYVDRITHLRDDPAYLEAAIADPRSRVVPVWDQLNLVVAEEPPRAALVALAGLPQSRRNADELILLGQMDGAPCFAVAVDAGAAAGIAGTARFQDLRTLLSVLGATDAGLLGYARALVSWRQRHWFCGSCGAGTRATKGGHVVTCTREGCGAEQFPRIDPAIIVLISDGERVLLGRQASWPAGRYSTIAGFVEPGESLEDAVRREVAEETGIPVDRILYHSSQPWPFPASLMLGFTAHALASRVSLNDRELEDARWFTREDIIQQRILMPTRQSISHRLIEHWLESAAGANTGWRPLPVARHHAPAVALAHPLVRRPCVAGPRRGPAAVDPDVAVAHPVPVAAQPDVARRGCDAVDFLARRRRRHQDDATHVVTLVRDDDTRGQRGGHRKTQQQVETRCADWLQCHSETPDPA